MSNISVVGLNEKLAGLILSVRDLSARIEASGMTGVQVKEAFAEMFPPSDLFSSEIRSMPAVYTNITDWLNDNGANVTPHSSRRIIMTLALLLLLWI